MGRRAVLPPQVGGNPGTQLGHAERLGQVIVRTNDRDRSARTAHRCGPSETESARPSRRECGGRRQSRPRRASSHPAGCSLPSGRAYRSAACRRCAFLPVWPSRSSAVFSSVQRSRSSSTARMFAIIAPLIAVSCKQGRMPRTADRHVPGRTSRTAACGRCRAGRCTAAMQHHGKNAEPLIVDGEHLGKGKTRLTAQACRKTRTKSHRKVTAAQTTSRRRLCVIQRIQQRCPRPEKHQPPSVMDVHKGSGAVMTHANTAEPIGAS